MRLRFASILFLLVAFSGCTSTHTGTANAKRYYNGTASVGDFMTIVIDPATSTMTYNNVSNGASGSIPYTTDGSGTYTLNDPTGNLISAYEVPGYALLVQAELMGPNQNTPALVTAVESGQISLSTFQNKSYNYMQLRTASGGVESGSVTLGTTSGANTSYWPYGAMNGPGNAFNIGTIDLSTAQLDSSGTFITITDPSNPSMDYIFGTSGGLFIVDTPNGAIIGLKKATNAAFDPNNAGTYTGIFYQKSNAQTGQGNIETGTPSFSTANVTVTSAGGITITDADSNTKATGTLVPVSSASYLYNGSQSELQDPCNGLFTLRITTGGTQQDVFVTFVNNTVLFSSFETALPFSYNNTYQYFYGVGLEQSSTPAALRR